ncbi:hypothetical protein BU17DRAFT_66582 [Hysterangium stoloniferum]|nr:hypothetical protein BU17DRAFT_66582 [Hysterangium stoloniferum]
MSDVLIDSIRFTTRTRYVQVASMTLLAYDYSKILALFFLFQSTTSGFRGLALDGGLKYYIPLSGIYHFSQLWPIQRAFSLKLSFIPRSSLGSSKGTNWFLYRAWICFGVFAGIQGELWLFPTPVHPHADLQAVISQLRLFVLSIPPILIETMSVMLVVGKAVQHSREETQDQWTTSRLLKCMSMYSVIYFVVTLVAYIAVFYSWIQLPVAAFELYIPLTLALPSVAANRMLLSIRALFSGTQPVTPAGAPATFLRPVVQPCGPADDSFLEMADTSCCLMQPYIGIGPDVDRTKLYSSRTASRIYDDDGALGYIRDLGMSTPIM